MNASKSILISIGTVLSGLALCCIGAQPGVQSLFTLRSPTIYLLTTDILLGSQAPESNVTFELVVVNPSREKCTVIGLGGICSCEAAIDFPIAIPSGDQIAIPIELRAPNARGEFSKQIEVSVDVLPGHSQDLVAHIQGTVEGDLFPTRQSQMKVSDRVTLGQSQQSLAD